MKQYNNLLLLLSEQKIVNSVEAFVNEFNLKLDF